jgi:hypothetical protein
MMTAGEKTLATPATVYFERAKALIAAADPKDAPTLEALSIPLYLLLKNGPTPVGIQNLKSRLMLSAAAQYLRIQYPRKSTNKQVGAVCFFADNLGQLLQQVPVYRALEKAGQNCAFLVHKPSLFHRLRMEGVVSVLIPVDFVRAKQPLSYTWHNPMNGHDWLTPTLVKQVEATALAHRHLPKLTAYAKDWAARYHPTAFVAGYDLNPACRAMTSAFQEKGVPSICIQHGTIGNDIVLARAHIVDHFFAFGEISKQKLLAAGVPYQVHVTGAPYLGHAFSEAAHRKHEMQVLMSGRLYEKMVLVAFSGAGHSTSEEHLKRQIAVMVKLAARYPAIGFTFKLHAKDKRVNYVAAEILPNCFVVQDSDFAVPLGIFDWLERCCAVVTGASAVVMEALVAGKQVFSLDFMGQYIGFDFVCDGATIYSESEVEFIQQFSAWLEAPSRFYEVMERGQRFVHQYFSHTKDAAERCAKVILEITNSKSQGVLNQPAKCKQIQNA